MRDGGGKYHLIIAGVGNRRRVLKTIPKPYQHPGLRQELKRFQRKRLGYSKDLNMHKKAIALLFDVYNFVRRHHSLGTTPAVAAGIEESRWSLERVVEMTEAYSQPKIAAIKAEKAAARRLAEDAVFAKGAQWQLGCVGGGSGAGSGFGVGVSGASFFCAIQATLPPPPAFANDKEVCAIYNRYFVAAVRAGQYAGYPTNVSA